jgi:tetratricopeptide (TPR) repeat protein
VLAGRRLRPSEAEAEIRRALANEPSSAAARLELAGLHLWGDNLGEAISEYMRVLDLDPFSADAFRGLYRVYDRRGDVERAAGAAQAICAVAAGREVPERKIAQQAAAPMEAMLGAAVASPLGVTDFWQLLAHHDEPKVARELLYLCADFLPQIFPNEVDRAASGSMLPVSEEDQLAQRCAQLARVLGVDRFETCIGQSLSASAVTLPGVPPRLVVDDGFAARASAAEFRFAAGRALAGVLTRSLYLSVLPPRSVELLLAAIVELYEKGFSGYLAQRREVEEISRALGRAIPRKLRKTLEEPARAYAAGQPVAAAAWYVASQRSAERAGLLLTGDVEAALAVLKAEKASRAVQADLLRFCVGPHLYEARRRLGLSI